MCIGPYDLLRKALNQPNLLVYENFGQAYMKHFYKYLAVMAVAISVMGFQLGSLTAAHADGGADLQVTTRMNFANTAIEFTVCNAGTSDVTEFVVDLDLTGFELYLGLNLPDNDYSPNPDNGGDAGTFDFDTMTWSGYLEYEVNDETHHNRCVYLGFSGHTTVALGDTAEVVGSVVSSTLSDASPNVDPDSGNNSDTVTPFVAALDPDIAIETRLKTSGEITASSHVTFEATVKNIGEGFYQYTGFTLVGFIMPDGSTLDSVTDADESDALRLVMTGDPGEEVPYCFSPGRAENLGMASLADYTGDIVVCFLETTADLPPGTSYPLEINITAGATFAAGTAEVVGLFEGNDPDTLELQVQLIAGIDIFQSGNNNIVNLSYDPQALRVTVSRCPGQGAVTSTGSGCFRVTFNKLIYADSFTADDIDLGGKGVVSSFEQLDDYTWEVNVAGMTAGQTLALLLGADSVQDYSAVMNNVQVLGENTIRFEAIDDGSDADDATNKTTANGTLAATGLRSFDMQTPLFLLILGSALLFAARKKKTIS